MEITKRYTLENWRTEEIDLHDIPDLVWTLTFEDILEKPFVEVNSLDLNPIELLFSCIFMHEGWRVERTPLSRNRPASKYTAVAIQSVTGVEDALFGSGVPDFLLWKQSGEYRFVEIKASEDELNPNQRNWADEYDCTFYIAQLAHISEEMTEKEMIDRNRIR